VGLIDDAGAFEPRFAEFNKRVPTRLLNRLYLPFYLPAATTAASPYVIGIVPVAAYVVDIKHVCETVTSAATLEVQIADKTDIMTAQAIAITVSTATLSATVSDRLLAAGDIISAVIATASGDIVNLAILIALEPVY